MTTTDLAKEHSPSPLDKQRWRKFRDSAYLYIKDFFLNAIVQVRVLNKAYPGVMHLLIFWGVSVWTFPEREFVIVEDSVNISI